MNRDQALSKIKKCLALAKSSNPHEAAAALRQAQKLMAEHRVTEGDVDLAEVTQQAARTRMQTATTWETSLAAMIADAFGCRLHRHTLLMSTFIGASKYRREWVFTGVGAAPSVAGYAFEVLGRQCERDRSDHIAKQPKACKTSTKTARGDQFAIGWVYGVSKLVDRFAGCDRDDALIDAYMARNHPDMKQMETRDRTKGRNVTNNDLHAGIHAGRSAKLDRGLDGAPHQGLLASSGATP